MQRTALIRAALGAALVSCAFQAHAQPAASEPITSGPATPAEPSSEPTESAEAQGVPPRLIESADLTLPPGVEVPSGAIEVTLTVETDGSVSEAQVDESLGPEADQAVIDAARRLRFEPARRDGEPVRARVGFRFDILPPPSAPESEIGPTPEAAPTPDDAEVAGEVSEEEVWTDDELLQYGARARIQKKPPGAATQVKLRGAELTNIPGTFGEPLRVVATLPGVARTPYGLGFFVVRGASFQNTGFLVDGFPVPLLYHLGAGPAIISSRLVDRLDFYPGGYPLAYGRFSAGIIALGTAPPPSDGARFEFEVDLLRASTLAVVPTGKGGSVAIALRRSYYDLFLPLITDDVTLFYTDYQLRYDQEFGDRFSASLFFFGARDELDIKSDTGAGATMGSSQTGLSYRFDRVILTLRWKPSDELRLSWAGTLGPSGFDLNQSSTGSPDLGADTDAFRLGERLEAVYMPMDLFQTTVGIEQNAYLTRLEGAAPSFAELPGIPAPEPISDSLAIEERLTELTFASYLEQVVRPRPFEITGGIRMEHYRYGNVATWVPEPRGVVRYSLTDDITLKSATGLFSQPPLAFQLLETYGNPDLDPTRAWQSSAGVEIELPASIEIDTSGFYSRMWQLPRGNARPDIDEEGNPTRSFVVADGQGRAYGWELLVRRRVERGLFGWLSYTLSRSERFLEDGEVSPFFFDQTHVLNLAASYQLGDWRFGARFALATGRPISDLLSDGSGGSVVFDADEDDHAFESGGARVRLPTFHQLDVRIDRAWTWGPVDGSVFLDIINVYNAPNSEGFVYEYDFSRRTRVPGLPFLPTIGVSGVIE